MFFMAKKFELQTENPLLDESKEEIIKHYIIFRSTDCKSKDALNNYTRYITKFLESIKKPLREIDNRHLTIYTNKISNEFSQTTLNVIKPLLKNFVKWLWYDYPLRFRELDKLCRTKKAVETYNPEDMLSEKEVGKIMNAERTVFWRAFWAIFFYGGFRPVEVTRLKWDKLMFEKDGTIIIKTRIEKNGKYAYKCIPVEPAKIITEFKKEATSELIFVSGDPRRKGKAISEKSPHKHLAEVSERAIGKHVNPYIFRHSVATILYNTDELPDDLVAEHMAHNESMKKTYNHLDEGKRIARSKKVWERKGMLSPEKKHKLEKELAKLKQKQIESDEKTAQLIKSIENITKAMK